MPDNPVAPGAAATPADPQSPQPAQPSPEELQKQLEEARQRLQEIQLREGRLRNEVGVMRRRTQELEQLAFNPDASQPPPAGDPSFTPAPPQYAPNYGYAPAPMLPPNVVSRDEFDLWRFRSQPGIDDATYQKVYAAAHDPGQLSRFIRYTAGPNGQAVPSVYDTYVAIHDSMIREAERKELEQLRAQQNPQRNPASATISGSAGFAVEQPTDLADLTPEQIKEKFPDAFPPQQFNPWGTK